MKKKKESHLTSRGKRNLSRDQPVQGHWGGERYWQFKKREGALGCCRRKALIMIFRKWMGGYWTTGRRLLGANRMEIYFLSIFPYIFFRRYFPFSCFLSCTCGYEATKIMTFSWICPQHTQGHLWLGYLPSSRSEMEVTCFPVVLVPTVHTVGITYQLVYSFPLSSSRASESFSTQYSRLPFLITQRGKGVNK